MSADFLPTGGRLAADSLLSNPLRTAATAVALTIGLSVVVVNSSMSSSFIGTINDQIGKAFARDFTVQAQGFTIEQGGGPGVPRSVQRAIEAMPETGTVAPMRAMQLDLPAVKSGSKLGLATGVDPARQPKVDGTEFQGVSRSEAYAELAQGGVLLGSTYAKQGAPRARRHRRARRPGRAAERDGDRGHRCDRPDERDGDADCRSTRCARCTATTSRPSSPSKPATQKQRPALEAKIGALLDRRYPNLEMQSAADAKKEVSDEINRTFNMFNAIVIIAIIVSLLGVINTLAMSVIERTREIGVLRALGASRWQIRATMLDESLMITMAGAVVGVLAGTLIGYTWLRGVDEVIPGLTFHFPGPIVVAVAIASVVLGVLAAILPARRAARLKVIEALVYE